MRQLVTVSLPKEIKKELDAITAQEGISRSDIVRESLKDYLFIHRFRSLRKQMVAKAQAHGIYSDQDVFDRVS
jgi:metal-responsive CopG/Arc/MetJ family transcriptional regulator